MEVRGKRREGESGGEGKEEGRKDWKGWKMNEKRKRG